MLYITEDECNCCVARLLLLLFCWCGDIESLNEERYWLRELKKFRSSEQIKRYCWNTSSMLLTLPPDELSNKSYFKTNLLCWCGDVESLNEERYWLRELKKIKISELWTNLEIMLEYEFMMLTLPPDELSNKKLLLNKLATENESKWRTAIWQP